MYFFHDLSDFCNLLLPIVGLAVLIVLAIVLIKVVKLLETANITIEKTHNSIKLVEDTLGKVQEPVDTVVKVAKTVDKVHDAGIKAVDDAKEYVTKNIELIKNKVDDLKGNKDKELKEPDLDDILKGE